MASFTFHSDPELQKSDLTSSEKQSKGALICSRTSLKGAKHLICVQYGCEKESKVVYSLKHENMASFTLNRGTELPKSDVASSE
jgi:hypothetical protein